MSATLATTRTWTWGGFLVVLGGCAALLARPWALRFTTRPTMALIALFLVLGVAGALWPLAANDPPTGSAVLVLAVGIGAFVLARMVAGGRPAVRPGLSAIALNSLAAVAEEAFFRRLLFGLLAPAGTAVAMVGSAVAFAAVHVTVWGVWVLPIDLAAGAVLSWQRWASGRWSVPAAAHVGANLLAVL